MGLALTLAAWFVLVTAHLGPAPLTLLLTMTAVMAVANTFYWEIRSPAYGILVNRILEGLLLVADAIKDSECTSADTAAHTLNKRSETSVLAHACRYLLLAHP